VGVCLADKLRAAPPAHAASAQPPNSVDRPLLWVDQKPLIISNAVLAFLWCLIRCILVDVATANDACAALFRQRGINITHPGFYDEPGFREAELADPTFLNHYATFVRTIFLDDAYRARARREIPFIADVVRHELVADGRLGACVDIGMMLSRILEQEGYWNYQVKGSLTIRFPPESGIPPKYFWSFDVVQERFAAAHSWLVAPPFSIADIAVRQQPYDNGGEFLPDAVVTERVTHATSSLRDLFSPSYCDVMRVQFGLAPNRIVQEREPRLIRFQQRFPPELVTYGRTRLKYIPVAIGAPDSPFAEMGNWRVNGRVAIELYRDVVQPQLREIRN
jgi:hypothetical protein